MYLMLGSIPDICFVINYFSRFQDNATDEHWNQLKRVLRYLKQTTDFKLTFVDGNVTGLLCAFVDSDWGIDIVDRKSTTGYVLKLFNCPVLWSSKKQRTIVISSTEAEYLTVSDVCHETLWMKSLFKDFCINLGTISLYEDNQGCIFIANNLETKRSKHIAIKHNFIRELLESEIIHLCYVPTLSQQADIFTKALCKPTFEKFRELIGVKEL